MSEENQAAQVDPLDAFVKEALDQGDKQTEQESTPVESATTEEFKAEETTTEKPAEDGFQKRINKVTADRYAETRRADALQVEIDKLKAANPADSLSEPKLEDPAIDYDDDKLRDAQIAYQIQEGVKTGLTNQATERKQEVQQAAAKEVADSFNERVKALDKADFTEKASAIPSLPAGVADALMQSESGAELIYHLGSHLDKADALAQMTPAAAMMELGRLSVEMSKKPEPKLSAAPDPIEPVKAGSALTSEISDDISMDAWMAKYG